MAIPKGDRFLCDGEGFIVCKAGAPSRQAAHTRPQVLYRSGGSRPTKMTPQFKVVPADRGRAELVALRVDISLTETSFSLEPPGRRHTLPEISQRGTALRGIVLVAEGAHQKGFLLGYPTALPWTHCWSTLPSPLAERMSPPQKKTPTGRRLSTRQVLLTLRGSVPPASPTLDAGELQIAGVSVPEPCVC
ncbi:hypothetical protein GWK47_054613 [Chionoecetes opilio]|uniref:Uncharacterized protein n=1 Tax=Chionoecetes opilio TaxID=41210 RepID=A0A8J4Y4X3_CHIOP|nr:hypothetical protein GWK47_054613 [Chionoecetes opilio]